MSLLDNKDLPQLPPTTEKTKRDEKGRIQKGSTGNPGGQSKAHRAARDALNQALSSPEMLKLALASLKRQMKKDNHAALIEYLNRIAGKVKDESTVDLKADIKDARPLKEVDSATLLATVKQLATKKVT